MEFFRTYQNPYRIKSGYDKKTKRHYITVYDVSRDKEVDYIYFGNDPTWNEIQKELIKRGYK